MAKTTSRQTTSAVHKRAAKYSAAAILARIDRRLDALKFSANEVGNAVGSRDIIHSIRKQVAAGKQKGVRTETIEKLAPVLRTTPEWLQKEAGPEEIDFDAHTGPVQRMARLVGYVGAGAEAHYYAVAQGDLDEVPALEGSTDSTVAVEIRGISLGELFDRWLVFYDDVRSPVTADMIGKLCVVGLSDDRILVKKIRRARDGLYTLLSENEPPIENAAVQWAAAVTGMRPR